MNVKQLIEYLEKKDPDMVAPMGFANPHSYRRYYACLAFEPVQNITIGAMLDYVIKAHGSTYQGLDGLEYRMNRDTEVYLAIEGRTGEKIGIVLLEYMTGVYEGEECKSLRGVISRSTGEIAGLIADRNNVRTDLASADSKLFEYRVQIVEQSKAIHDLITDIKSADVTIKEDHRRIDSLVEERNDLNRWFINDRDTLRSIERTWAELSMYCPDMKIRDVKAIKSMKRISNIMEGWDPNIGREKESEDCCIREDIISVATDRISNIEVGQLKTINALFRGHIENMNEEKVQINKDIEAMTGTISEQNQALLHIKAELDAAKQFNPFDLVLISGSMENISNVIKDHKKSFINEERIECARLKKELDAKTEIIKQQSNTIEDLNSRCDSLEKDREFEHIISDSYRDDIEDLKDSIRGLEAELASAAKSLLDSSDSIFNRDSIIEGKIVTISQLKNRVEGQENILQSWQEEIEDLKTELVIRNVPAMEESLKSSARLALRQDDEITALKAEMDRLRGIRNEHDYNTDLLEDNKLKFHKIAELEAELAVFKADSGVLKKVVDVIRDWDDGTGRAFPALYKIVGLLVDYTDIPEVE